MKIKFYYYIVIIVEILYCVSAEFIKMKKPYSPLNELNLKQFVSANFSSNKNVDRNRQIEYIQKYFPGFNNRKKNIRFHEIDDPVFQQHNITTPKASNNNHNPTFINQPVISSINGITIAAQQQTSSTNIPHPLNTRMPPLIHNIECSEDQANGTWSRWVISEACTADCGSCGRITRTRQCLSFNSKSGTGCPCRGEYKQLEPCNIGVCQFPKPSCCPPYNLIFIEGHFGCGPHNERIIQNFLQQVSNG